MPPTLFETGEAGQPPVISQPASSERDWLLGVLLRGYADSGMENPQWDAQATKAFEAFSDVAYIKGTKPSIVTDALKDAQEAGCPDPVIRHLCARFQVELEGAEQLAVKLLQAHSKLIESRHHPALKFHGGLIAVQAARKVNSRNNLNRRIDWVIEHFKGFAQDTNAPVVEIFDGAKELLEYRTTKQWVDHVTGHMDPILEQHWGNHEQWIRFQGREEIKRAWAARTGSWATEVTSEGWRGFEEHLAKAETHLNKAWQMNSNSVDTALLMMTLELGQGQGRAREEKWFKIAMSLDPDCHEAVNKMRYYLEPKWYGSEPDVLKFARSCVASKEWGGQVPLVLATTHQNLANYYDLDESPEYWHRPQVWTDIRSAYEKFFKLNPDAHGWRHDYARHAYLCRQYAVFLDQAKLFEHGTNYTFFGGPEKFQAMIAHATEETARHSN